MTELLQPFSLREEQTSDDLQKASELLHAVTGKGYRVDSDAAIVDDLTTYDAYMGGRFGSFLIHRDEQRVIRALAYVARYPASMELVALSVDEVARNKGIGRQVLDVLIEESEESSRPIWLHTGRGNTGARRFFRRAGFQELPESDFRQNTESKFIALERPVQSLAELAIINT